MLGGAFLAAYAQYRVLPSATAINPWSIAGLGAAGAVFIGGIFIAFTERNPFMDLRQAHEALEAARAREEKINDDLENFRQVEHETNRLRDLYSAMDVMRSAVQLAMTVPTGGETATIERLLEAAERPLLLACDFAHPQHWTLCVYNATIDPESKHATLKCIAHSRSIKCDIAQARTWEEGEGITGAVYARGMEIIIPDLLARELGTSYELKPQNKRDYDTVRYRAIIGVPIKVGTEMKPWGVVIATSSDPGHFTPDHVSGVRTVEGPRALAGMVALAIQACHPVGPAAKA